MNKIIKFLNENNIEFEQNNKDNITIFLEKNLEFTNSYGDKIKYDNYITITNKYSYHPYQMKRFKERKMVLNFQDGKQSNMIEKIKSELL